MVLRGKLLKLARIKDYVPNLANIAPVVMDALKLIALHAQNSQAALPVNPAPKLNVIPKGAQQYQPHHPHHPQPVKTLVKAVLLDVPLSLVQVEVVIRLTVLLVRTAILPVVRLRRVLSGTVLVLGAELLIAPHGYLHRLASTKIYALILAPIPHVETIASKPIALSAVITHPVLPQKPAHRRHVID